MTIFGINSGICKEEGCDNEAYARGLCRKHYKIVWLRGERAPLSPYEAFVQEVMEYEGDDCFFSTLKGVSGRGRPKLKYKGVTRNGARIICELYRGPPDEPWYEAHHTCPNRKCLNKRHIIWLDPAVHKLVTHGWTPILDENGKCIAVVKEAAMAAKLEKGK